MSSDRDVRPSWLAEALDGEGPLFRITERPEPVPVELRRAWRLAVLLLVLKTSRSKRASHDKLLLINSGMRTTESRVRLREILRDERSPFFLELRVDPALGRALDFGVGLGLFERLSRSRFQLTSEGEEVADALWEEESILQDEKLFLEDIKRSVPEYKVQQVLTWR